MLRGLFLSALLSTSALADGVSVPGLPPFAGSHAAVRFPPSSGGGSGSLTIDGTPATNNTWSGSASGTITSSTTGSVGTYVVVVYNESTVTPSLTLSSVTASGLTFTKRIQIANTGAGEVGTSWNDLEIWTAPYSSALASKVITMALSASTDDACVVGFGVSGGNTATPWDSSTPGQNTSTTPVNTLSVAQSTSNTNDMLLLAGGLQAQGNPIVSGNFGSTSATSIILSGANSGGTNACSLGVQYLNVSATQSAIDDTMMNAGGGAWLGIADALVASGG